MGLLRQLRYSSGDVWRLQTNAVHLLPILRSRQLWNQETGDEVFSRNPSTARSEMLPIEAIEEKPIAEETVAGRRGELPWKPLCRIAWFFGVVVLLTFVMHAMITSGLRHIKTSAFGAENQIIEGKVNAKIVIVGSSRALDHYDTRTIKM